MKKQSILLFALILCLTLLNGCKLAAKTETDAPMGDFSKAQQIVISDSATGEVLTVLTGKDDISAFCEKLDGGSWDIRDFEDIPADAERECAFAMYQTETIKAGMAPEDAEMVLLCTMYTYRGSGCLTMEFPFATFPFTLSGTAAEYLHSFAQ